VGTRRISFWAGAATVLWLAASVVSCNRPNASAPVPAATEAPLIARADLFGDAVRAKAQLSPRGDRIAFLAPRDGTLNLWVVPVDAMGQARPLTDDQSRGVRYFVWAENGTDILYLQDVEGDENWRLNVVTVESGESRALTPAGSRAEILGLSPNDPTGVVIALNDRDAAWPDVYRYDLVTGARTLLQRNTNSATVRGFARFVVDHDNQLRLGLKTLPEGGVEVFTRAAAGRWASLFTIPFEDSMASKPIAFEADGRSFLMLDSTGRDRAALVRVDAASGVKTVLGESQRADVVDVWLDPATNAPQAFGADYLRREWRVIDPAAQGDLDFLDAQLQGEASVTSRSLDDNRWIVVEDGPTTPARSYLYDRADPNNRRLTLLFRHRPALEQQPLQPMIPQEIEARDGLTLVSYLTLPIGSDANGDALPDAPAPLVLLAHGGPWTRDSYGFNAMHQWLANRGYAVLSVNFRGSTGFGKAFLNAGNREWGGRMQEDLLDAVQWAVENGIAQPERVAIIGGSYGGYAALAGLAFTPERFACAVSFAGIVNLPTLFDHIPAYWTAYREDLYLRVGDPRTPEGRQMLRERSPLTAAAQIRRPLLLAQGLHDPLSETELIAQSLRARRANFIYLAYPDEGHILARPQNRLSFYAATEHFLGGCLGGRVEPVGAAFEGASLQAIDGAQSVPGLSAFVRRPAPPPVAPAATDGAGGPDESALSPEDAAVSPTEASSVPSTP
jgi:dipeptidyl aminopeptidase/acylaminoacyl peptidase